MSRARATVTADTVGSVVRGPDAPRRRRASEMPITSPLPGRKKAVVVTEKQFKDAVVAALHELPGTLAWVQNSGLAKGQAGGVVSLMPDGASDVGAAVRLGPAAAWVQVECKMPRGQIRESQTKWRAAVEEVGGVYLLARYDRSKTLLENAADVRDAVRAELERRHRDHQEDHPRHDHDPDA